MNEPSASTSYTMTIDQTPAYSKEFVDSLLKACVDYRSQVDQLERENAALRALLSEPYGFFTFGHKALSPWGKALDNWCERAKPLLEKKEAQP